MKSLLLILVATLISTSSLYAIDLSDSPRCERNVSGTVVCPNFVNQIVPSDTLILIQDSCPSGDASASRFDKTCGVISGSTATGILKFGTIDKYLHTSSYLEYLANAEISISVDSITIDGTSFPILSGNIIIIEGMTFSIIDNKLVPTSKDTNLS